MFQDTTQKPGPSQRRLTRAPQGDRWLAALAVTAGDRWLSALTVAAGDRARHPLGHHGRPVSPPSRSPWATGTRLLCCRHGRPASPPSRSTRATNTRLPRGRCWRPVPRLWWPPRGDQLLVLPGRHGAVGATLTDNPPSMFNVPLMLPLENYDKTTKVRLSKNSNGPCEMTMVKLNRVGRIAGLSIQQRRRRIKNDFSGNHP